MNFIIDERGVQVNVFKVYDTVTFDGKTYELTYDTDTIALNTEPDAKVATCEAVCRDCEPDSDGKYPVFEVTWRHYTREELGNQFNEEESYIYESCEWEEPDSVREIDRTYMIIDPHTIILTNRKGA